MYRNKEIARVIGSNCVCVMTGTPNPDPHHIKGEGFGSVKAPDYMQIALRHELHQELHYIGYKAFERKYGVTQREMLIDTLTQLRNYIDFYFWDDPDFPLWIVENL